MTAAAAALVVLALGAAAAPSGAEDELMPKPPLPAFAVGEESGGVEVSVPVGTVFAVELESASGGGYLWSVTRADPSRLELVARETLPRPERGGPRVLGAPALQRFLFRALAPGAADLVLSLARPWEGAGPERTFSLRVRVVPAD